MRSRTDPIDQLEAEAGARAWAVPVVPQREAATTTRTLPFPPDMLTLDMRTLDMQAV